MRNVPFDLLQKLKGQLKSACNDADERLRVVVTQITSNTLLSEIIHEDIAPNYGDVAIRQLLGDNSISLAYALCIDNGIANIYYRNFPSPLENPWNFDWTLGAATDVGIEYNGTWILNSKKQWYYLQTEEFPYIFFVQSGNLYVQHWKDESTRILLDTGVSQLSVCKGWKSDLINDLDQGLVVGYIKSGSVFYRAFCMQTDGKTMWEPIHEIEQLGTENTSLCVFRTNDFRIGFLTENQGEMKYVLSHRNYAGMSVRPESVNVQIVRPRVIFDRLQDKMGYTDESTQCEAKYLYAILLKSDYEVISVLSAERINHETDFASLGVKLTLSHALHGEVMPDFKEHVVVEPTTSIDFVEYEENVVTIMFATPIRRNIALTITVNETRSVWYLVDGKQKHPLTKVTASIEADVVKHYVYENEAVVINMLHADMMYQDIVYKRGYMDEAVMVSVVSASMMLQATADLPI